MAWVELKANLVAFHKYLDVGLDGWRYHCGSGIEKLAYVYLTIFPDS